MEKPFAVESTPVESKNLGVRFDVKEKQVKEDAQPNPQRLALCHGIVAFLVTSAAAWIPPLSFSGFQTEQIFSRFWLFISDTGAQWGVGFVMLLATALIATKHTELKVKIFKAIQFLAGLFAVLLSFALINEFVTKPAASKHRPYIIKLEKEGLLIGNDYYALETRAERTEFLKKLFEEKLDHPLVKSIHPSIRQHWESETGFSFPSGHSQNAFLFAMILSYLIGELVSNGKRWMWVPFLWAGAICLSRVALGVHSPLDVTIGALTGGLIGGLILKLGLLNKLIQKEASQE